MQGPAAPDLQSLAAVPLWLVLLAGVMRTAPEGSLWQTADSADAQLRPELRFDYLTTGQVAVCGEGLGGWLPLQCCIRHCALVALRCEAVVIGRSSCQRSQYATRSRMPGTMLHQPLWK